MIFIGLRFGLDYLDIAALNGIPGPDHVVRPGDFLWLPDPGTTVVRPGENLSFIGLRLGLDYLDIAALNGIPGPDYIVSPGQVLRIP